MDLFYSQTNRPTGKKQQFRNPRFFTGPELNVGSVTIDGIYPEIENAYLDAGVKVKRVGQGGVAVIEPTPLAPPKDLAPKLTKAGLDAPKDQAE